ncbi:MAG: hypothetical protein ACRD2R_06445, partial [Terriglobales bacterium]
MNIARVLFHMMRADFLERTRRYSFLVTLGFAVYAAWMFLPPNPSPYATLQFAGHRGVYNSAWVGAAVALLCSTFLSIVGFYLVKNALDRDQQTRVGQVLAATPLSRPLYTAGKALSNFAFLSVMVGVVAATAGVTQLSRGEAPSLELSKLLLPLLFLTLPMMAVVGALAILFESVPVLRRGLGNVVFFFAWISFLGVTIPRGKTGIPLRDILGIQAVVPAMEEAVHAAFPDYDPVRGGFSMGINIRGEENLWRFTTFVWEGISWTGEILLQRVFWLAVAAGLALLAAAFFHRFDPAGRFAAVSAGVGKLRRRPSAAARDGENGEPSAPAAPAGPRLPRDVHLTPFAPGRRRVRFAALLAAELRLMLKGVSRWWLLVAAGLALGSALAPPEAAPRVLAFAWIWPLTLWSSMGTRELRHDTGRILFCSAHSLRRQLPAAWMAGAWLAVFTGSGAFLRLALDLDWQGMAAWAVGALFIPSLALALGVWTGSSKAFEALYVSLWYIGPLQAFAPLDFMGISPVAFGAG